MPEIGTSSSTSGDGKRSVGHRPQATAPVLDSTKAAVEECQLFRRCQGVSRHSASCPKTTLMDPEQTNAVLPPEISLMGIHRWLRLGPRRLA